jgi:hypothetical protein
MTKCSFENCKKQPYFNEEGKTKGLYCSKHKTENMVNVISKTCIHPNCKTIPYFNVEGQTKGLFCLEHKSENMVNVKSKTCVHPNCKTIPYFNVEGQTKGLFCLEHKTENMVDIKNKTCIHSNCKKQPVFNIEGQTKGLFCSEHKSENMINVKNKTCIHPNCKKQSVFNEEGQSKGLFCSEHKSENMVDIKNKTCIHPNCKTRPNYNEEGQTKGLFCSEHKSENMVDVKHKTCKTHLCNIRVEDKYDGYCLRCYIHLFPDKPNTRNYKTKEKNVTDFITINFQNLNCIIDKKINDGCSRRRPDLLLDLGYQIIIVEVDENQHIDYDCSCENKRIMELSQDVDHRPIIFIRFNPDKYIKNGKTISSCWTINNLGVCNVSKTKLKEWNNRLDVLKEQIIYWIEPINKTNKTIEIIQLFYDVK